MYALNQLVYNVITLNANDKYFDNGAGGITRASDNKEVDILIGSTYAVPRGKVAPTPPTPTKIAVPNTGNADIYFDDTKTTAEYEALFNQVTLSGSTYAIAMSDTEEAEIDWVPNNRMVMFGTTTAEAFFNIDTLVWTPSKPEFPLAINELISESAGNPVGAENSKLIDIFYCLG